MSDFRYASGRIAESVQFLTEEIREFDKDYSQKTWEDYQRDRKLQKLMDRTVENILTALIEVCGTILVEEGIGAASYSEVLRKAAGYFGFLEEDQNKLAKLAVQRNRLAHRYLNFRWEAIRMFKEMRALILEVMERVLKREEERLKKMNP